MKNLVCDPDNEIFPVSWKYIDAMRQSQKSTSNVFENMVNDLWTEAKGVTISEEWTGIARFQILRARLLERYKLVNGKPTKKRKTTRPDSVWSEAWIRLSETQQET